MDRGNGSNFPKILNQKYDIVVGPGSTHDRVDLVPSWMESIEVEIVSSDTRIELKAIASEANIYVIYLLC